MWRSTPVDTASSLVELIWINSNILGYIIGKFVQCWFTHDPCSVHYVHNEVGEFIEKLLMDPGQFQHHGYSIHKLKVKIWKQAWFMNICTKQWAVSHAQFYTAINHKTLHKLGILSIRHQQLTAMHVVQVKVALWPQEEPLTLSKATHVFKCPTNCRLAPQLSVMNVCQSQPSPGQQVLKKVMTMTRSELIPLVLIQWSKLM